MSADFFRIFGMSRDGTLIIHEHRERKVIDRRWDELVKKGDLLFCHYVERSGDQWTATDHYLRKKS